jgi:small subunit ribosomal protein S7
MRDGKKTVAQKIVYKTLSELEKQQLPPSETIEKAVNLIGPRMTVRPRRIGGASYMVPKETTPKHRIYLALSWIITAARARSNKEYHTFEQKLTAEIIDVINGKGAAVEKKTQTEKLAEANKVFAHFGW